MPVVIIVDLIICEERMEEFTRIINEDKKMAAEDNTITQFDIMVDSEIHNKIQIKTVAESMESVKEHMASKHYRWKDFMKSGGVVSHRHDFQKI
jgi:quinol monooxygenase YgiN